MTDKPFEPFEMESEKRDRVKKEKEDQVKETSDMVDRLFKDKKDYTSQTSFEDMFGNSQTEAPPILLGNKEQPIASLAGGKDNHREKWEQENRARDTATDPYENLKSIDRNDYAGADYERAQKSRNADEESYLNRAAQHYDKAAEDVAKGIAKTTHNAWNDAVSAASKTRQAITPSGRENMNTIQSSYDEASKEGFKYSGSQLNKEGVNIYTPETGLQLVPHKEGELYRQKTFMTNLNTGTKKAIEDELAHFRSKPKKGSDDGITSDMDNDEREILRAYAGSGVDSATIANMVKQFKQTKAEQRIAENLNSGGGGPLGWLSKKKTEMQALSIGGMPKGKVAFKLMPKVVDGKYIFKTAPVEVWTNVKDNEGNVKRVKTIEMQPLLDARGNPIAEMEMTPTYETAMITIPIKGKEGWYMSSEVEATHANVRLSIERRKAMEAETKKKESETKYKEMQTSDLRSLMSNRERNANLGEARVQAARMGNFQFGSTNFGREPIYMVTNEMGATRDKYTLGGSTGRFAPSVRASLAAGRQGLGNMSERVLSNYSAPLTVNPLLRVGLPDVVGNRMQMNPRYVTGPQVPTGVARLGLNTGEGRGILDRLSPIKKKKTF